MNKIEFIKENFGKNFKEISIDHSFLVGTKYAGCRTHCRSCMYTLVKMLRPSSVLEIGSYHFDSTRAMAKAMDEIGVDGKIDSFDILQGGYDGSSAKPGHSRIRADLWYPHHTSYDNWKLTAPIAKPEFKNMSDEDIFKANCLILEKVAPLNGYDFIFIDGDHSFEGVGFDWQYALEFSHKETVVAIDDIWDTRLQGVRNFYDTLQTIKWDFESWNDSHRDLVQSTGVSLTY